ncbi:MAG: GNAT family N-acetyltransferase [Gaiellaceae bacterium]
MDVKPIPGLEHLPFAEVWLREPDDTLWRQASALARAIGKDGLEVWTTDATPDVVPFLEQRGYEIVRRYRITELDVDAAPDPDPPAFPLTTFAARPDLAAELYEVACEAYPDQPGRSEQRISPFDVWRSWGLDPHPPDAYFIALDGERVLGYGYLEVEGDRATHGFMALRREVRGRGLGGAIKRAQIAWAKQHDVRTLRTATELRLASMLSLNERLGYRPLYTEFVLRGPAAD